MMKKRKVKRVVLGEVKPIVVRRFNRKFIPQENGCFLWIGAKRGKNGKYPCFRYKGKTLQAHRFAYLLINKSIPSGMEIDHKCRNTLCVNHNHLEPVTRAENQLRAREKACKYGHTEFWKERPAGGRKCMQCDRDRALKYYYNKKV